MTLPTTPIKSTKHVCVVCKIDKSVARSINSDAGKKKKLSELLQIYGDVNIIEGIVCQNCERKLLIIDKSVTDFKKQCQTSLSLLCGKRCSSNVENHAKKGLELFDSEPLPLNERSLNDTDNINFCDLTPTHYSTPQSTKYVRNIASKENSFDSGFISLDALTSTASTSNSFNEHDYATNKHPEENKSATSGKNTKVPEIPEIIQKVLLSQNVERESDVLSRTEIALIQASFPLCSRKELVKAIYQQPLLKRVSIDLMLEELSKDKTVLRSRKHGRKSQLMMKDITHLKNFRWEDVVEELTEEFPLLSEVLLAVIVPQNSNEAKRRKQLTSILPKLGMVGIIFEKIDVIN